MDINEILLNLCGIFYAVLCIFSIVTGLIYVNGRKELNPLELSDEYFRKYWEIHKEGEEEDDE